VYPGNELFSQLIGKDIRDCFVGLQKYFRNAADDRAKTYPIDKDFTLTLALGITGEISKSGFLNIAVVGVDDGGFALTEGRKSLSSLRYISLVPNEAR